MRSRYTAFALGDTVHLARTWHPATRPADLDADRGTDWLGLTIVRAAGGAPDDDGVVEFRARWRAGGVTGELHEVSRFRRLRGRWVYVDGIIDEAS
ncbi:YchJ family protein [Microbacterium oleivorans]|nr:YchJ family metal-binding protein [Microbacterium oleivorans]